MKIKKLSKPSIWVIVLNYNGKETLNNCLASIYQSDWSNFEVVVVDNNSSDGSFEQARSNFARAHFIRNSANIGFAKGNNVGIRYALEKFADFILVLNNDTLLEKETITNLMQVSKDNQDCILSPLILGPDKKTPWFAGGKIDWKNMRTVHITAAKIDSESDYLSGCAMLIPKSVFKSIGLFDERFFLYYEDTDFCFRAKKAGFNLLITPEAKIIHLEKSNSNNQRKLYWLVLSGLIFFRIHTKGKRKAWFWFHYFLRYIKNTYNSILKPSKKTSQMKRAFADFSKFSLK